MLIPKPPPLSCGQAKALVLAAGRGERMRPLSDLTPKPLLQVRGRALLEHMLDQLGAAGIGHALINTAWLGEQIRSHLPNPFVCQVKGEREVQLDLSFSSEDLDFAGALETGGGIVRALPSMAESFWVVAGDVYAPNFDFPKAAEAQFLASAHLAHLWLVPNPEHHPRGDFWIQDGLACRLEDANAQPFPQTYTFSTIALYKKAFFQAPYCPIEAGNPLGIKAALAPWLKAAMKDHRVGACVFAGPWTDVGTPSRLAQLNR